MTLFQRWAVFFRQLHGIVAATNRYHGTLPAPETFHTTVSYRLPFQGSWTVLNGGITQATSHTWELPIVAADKAVETARFAGKPVLRVPVSYYLPFPLCQTNDNTHSYSHDAWTCPQENTAQTLPSYSVRTKENPVPSRYTT